MSGSKGIEGNVCKWCGLTPRLDGNEYCSPDCYYHSHDASLLIQIWTNDRSALQRTLRDITSSLSELNRSLSEDGLQGEEAHSELRATADAMKANAAMVGARIEKLTQEIECLDRRLSGC